MDVTTDTSRLPIDFEGSLDPAQLPEVTLGHQSIMAATDQMSPMMRPGGDRLSPVRGRTMKEYDQQISDLKKENFSLKMRIYYMEERMQQRFGDGQDVFKTNIELQVEIDNLKRELADKQVLVQKAALAMETLTAKYEQEEETIRNRVLADYRQDIIQIRDQLDKANQKCERSYEDMADAERKLQLLKQQLDDVRGELANSRRTNQDLTSKLTSTEFGAQTLTGQLKLAEQAKEKLDRENDELNQKLKDLEDQLQDVNRKSTRKDRDILNLSNILQEQSHVDCTSILEPVHLQDELDDLKEAVTKKNGQVGDLEAKLKDKEDAVKDLMNSVSELEEKLKEAENALELTKKDLQEKNSKYKKCIEGLAKTIYQKDKEIKDQKLKLVEFEEEIKLLQKSMKEMEIQKTKEVDNLTNQLTEADVDNRRLKYQLNEANETSEDMVKKLGKREGELAGFQDQLSKVMDALNKSDEAVEILQAQLKAERAEFEDRLREQACLQVTSGSKPESNIELEDLKQQIIDLQKLIASQNAELLGLATDRHELGDLHGRLKEKDSELELLSTEHKREMAELEREIQALKSDSYNKDMKIEALENQKSWLEDNHRETLERMKETWNDVGGISQVRNFSLDLLQEIRLLMDLLRREISFLATLQLQLGDKPEHGLASEVLVTEITSVQRIYKQFQEGVETNGRLHQVLLDSLRQEHRLSDSPDSNSCQDGGYNMTSANTQAKLKRLSVSSDTRQVDSKTPQSGAKSGTTAVQSESLSSLESEWEHPHGYQSVAVETCPELIDRSLQTGTSFTHIDQWVQTSPRVADISQDCLTNTSGQDLGQLPLISRPIENRKLPLVDSEGDVRLYIFGLHNDSLTDDAKEEHLGLRSESLEDYHNFQRGVFCDEHRMNSCNDHSLSKLDDPSQLPSPGRKFLLSKTDSSVAYRPGNGSKIANINLNGDCDRFSSSSLTRLHEASDTDEPDGNSYIPYSSTKMGLSPSSHDRGSTYTPEKYLEQKNDNSSYGNQLTIKSSINSYAHENYDENYSANLTSRLSPNTFMSRNIDTDLLLTGCKHANYKQDLSQDDSTSENPQAVKDIVKKYSEGTEKNEIDYLSVKRRNSWAEELEKYKVPENEKLLGYQDDKSWGKQEVIFRTLHPVQGLDYSPEAIENLSPAELRHLVWDMQKNVVSASTLNQKLQENLDSVNNALNELRMKDCNTTGADICSHKDINVGVQRSRIPRPLDHNSTANSSSLMTTATNTSGSKLQVKPRSENHHSVNSAAQHNLISPEKDTVKKTVVSKTEDISSSFTEPSNQVKILEEKLLVAEHSVRRLVKKSNAYLSALITAGVSNEVIDRADDEFCLQSSITRLQDGGDGAVPLIDLDTNGSNNGLVGSESMERVRSIFPNNFSQSSYGRDHTETLSSTPAFVLADVTERSLENNTAVGSRSGELQDRTITDENYSTSGKKSSTLSSMKHSNKNDNNPTQMENSGPSTDKYHDGLLLSLDKTKSDTSHQQNRSPHSTNNISLLHQNFDEQKSQRTHGNGSQRHSSSRLTMDASVFDQSGYPDVTYSSILDNTVISRLLANLEGSTSAIKEEAVDMSNLTLEQLQLRVDHLERVNLTLREEIGVYEALHQSQGTHVTPSFSAEFGGQASGCTTEDDLLKQHLIEIRKLRQRLERLDVTKDPEQLLIFQSHTQQRIIHQEKMILNLQQVLVEKEEQWQRTLAELQHKLSREKALFIQKLETTISELQREIHDQNSTIDQQKRKILDLNSELKSRDELEEMKDKEMKRVLQEKSELEDDLLKRDKEFLDVEKNLFKLEMEKENSQSECRRFCVEIDEKEKENEKLRKMIDESKESSRLLRDTVVKCENAIQEKIFTLQKMKHEKAASDQRLVEKDGRMKELELVIGGLKKDLNSVFEQKAGLVAEVDLLREDLKKKENVETKYEFQKVSYETEMERIREEKTKLTVQLESSNLERSELNKQVDEFKQKLLSKTLLENEIFFLKEEVKTLSRLQERVDDLKAELDAKLLTEAELKEKLSAVSRMQVEVDELREKLFKAESEVRQKDEERMKAMVDLREKDEKVKKRDRQINHLLAQCKKLDTAFTKQKYLLNEKVELEHSLKKQMHLYEVTLACASQEEKDSIMKQLLKELIATQRQVEELLSKLEHNSATLRTPLVLYDGFNMTSTKTTTTTITTKHQDAHKEEIPESEFNSADLLFDDKISAASDVDQENIYHSIRALTPISTNAMSPRHPHSSSQTASPNRSVGQQCKYSSDVDAKTDASYDEINVSARTDLEIGNTRSHLALSPMSTNSLSPHRPHLSSLAAISRTDSPRKDLKHFTDQHYIIPKGAGVPPSFLGSNNRNLVAVLKLEYHEKLRKETGECLVTLSGIEARLDSRLKMYKSKSVSESLDYSTLRETSLSCQNMRVCLEEASRLIILAWITELPPLDSQGHFYNPVLVEQNESLKRELAELTALHDLREPGLKGYHGLNTTSESSRLWETSLYQQLHKTSKDLEQAKENIDTSLAELPSPRRYQSFTNYSPHKSPRRRLEDTL